jgi:predicted MFS family arabinose efflux permease
MGTVSAVLLGFGVANFLGTLIAGRLLERSLRLTLMSMPLLMAILGLGLVALGRDPMAASFMVGFWGLAFGAVPVAWSTWLTRTVPDQAESAGGLLVAAIQLAIAMGAGAGGGILDISSVTGVFAASSATLLLAALMILLGVRSRTAAAIV